MSDGFKQIPISQFCDVEEDGVGEDFKDFRSHSLTNVVKLSLSCIEIFPRSIPVEVLPLQVYLTLKAVPCFSYGSGLFDS